MKELLGFWMANEIPKQETDYDGWLDGQSRIFAREVIPFRIREHDAIVRVHPVNEFALIFHSSYSEPLGNSGDHHFPPGITQDGISRLRVNV